MDPRRFLTVAAAIPLLGGCALFDPSAATRAPMEAASLLPGPATAAPSEPSPTRLAGPPPETDTARPYLEAVRDTAPRRTSAPDPRSTGRVAISAANVEARAASTADRFVGGVQVFGWSAGRIYEIWTAPLRVTALTLAPGETVTAKAAGDTVRWQIGEAVSGQGGSARTHVLIKPLQAGLETNLIVTTNQRVYLLTLSSGNPDASNTAVAWNYGRTPAPTDPIGGLPDLPAPDLSVVTPQGPLDARYRIEAQGRTPSWMPTSVFNDGVRTFITLPHEARVDETPALFVHARGEPQLVNYRQVAGMMIVDRVFEAAELRLGDRRPQVVRIRRLQGDAQ